MEVLARARAVRRLRTAVLAVLLLVLVGGGGLWWLGRSVGPRSEDRPADQTSVRTGGGALEFTVSDGDRPLFRVRALGGDQDSAGVADLERVELTLYREDGREIQVAADRARYEVEKREGVLSGNVIVTSERGMRLESDTLALADQGRILTSEAPVTFYLGDETRLQGRADRLRFDFRRQMFALAGSVEIWTLDDPRQFRLSAGRLLLENGPQRLIRAEIGVRLSERDGDLFARRMAIYFAPDGQHIEFVRGRWQVMANWRLTGPSREEGVRSLTARGEGFSLLLDTATGQPRKLELEGTWLERARLEVERPGGGLADVLARFVQGDFADGRLAEVLALGQVEIAETTRGAPLADRLACGGRATAAFTPQGEVARLALDDQVDLHQSGFQASGEKVESLASTGVSTLTGAPALLLSPQGELRAPEMVLRQGGELVEALGGVDARMPRRGFAVLGQGAGADAAWVQVRAARAQLLKNGEAWSFEEGVRAWSGADVLSADQLRGDGAGRSLIASGSVETVARLVRQDGSTTPLRVQARTLEYAPDRSMILYRGDVVAREEGRRISCDELEVSLDDTGQAREAKFRGAVHLTESGTGRSVKASEARYDPSGAQIQFEGDPAVLEDGKGGRLSGRRVDYDTTTGQVRVAGRAEAP